MADKDVTDQVEFGSNDGEYLPLIKCVCGFDFEMWNFMLSIYKDDAEVCPSCGRKLYFRNKIVIYEVNEVCEVKE